ncbi:MAG: FIST N-terminal domain-containing protein [Bacteroidota bacterium]
MNVQQLSLKEGTWLKAIDALNINCDLCLVFASPDFKATQAVVDTLKRQFPKTLIAGCSTAGEISNVSVEDKTISLTAIQFETTKSKLVSFDIKSSDCSFDRGQKIATELMGNDLKHVLIFSDGLNVNGADLVSGLKSKFSNVSITGGLAGDGADFKKTFVIANDQIADKTVVGLGLYGKDLSVGYGSKGGWDSFGIERMVTKSKKNVLYELDGMPALNLYKSFLGEQAKNLPLSALLFPLSMRCHENNRPIVRTILGVNEADQSLTFAGNITENSYVRLMKSNIDRLIDGAEDSAILANQTLNCETELAILISCVGRRLVMKQMVEEEVEAVKETIGKKASITGFYSYGEIAPFEKFSPCELHNQTMTVTTLSEC